MSTPNRTEINRAEMNRANAQHSTGPNTEAGKQRSSMNALKHGLTGHLRFMSDEVLEIYQAHVKSFHDEYQPQGATEENLVQSLVDDSWRLNRIAELEADLLGVDWGLDGFLDQTKALVNLSLHSQRLSRQFERTVAQLRDLQKTRRSPENWEIAKLLNIVEARQEDGFVFSDTQINHAILPPDHRVLPSRDHRERFQSRIV